MCVCVRCVSSITIATDKSKLVNSRMFFLLYSFRWLSAVEVRIAKFGDIGYNINRYWFDFMCCFLFFVSFESIGLKCVCFVYSAGPKNKYANNNSHQGKFRVALDIEDCLDRFYGGYYSGKAELLLVTNPTLSMLIVRKTHSHLQIGHAAVNGIAPINSFSCWPTHLQRLTSRWPCSSMAPWKRTKSTIKNATNIGNAHCPCWSISVWLAHRRRKSGGCRHPGCVRAFAMRCEALTSW